MTISLSLRQNAYHKVDGHCILWRSSLGFPVAEPFWPGADKKSTKGDELSTENANNVPAWIRRVSPTFAGRCDEQGAEVETLHAQLAAAQTQLTAISNQKAEAEERLASVSAHAG